MVGEELRDARVAAGLTQEEVAARAGVDRSYLSRLEHGHQSPTVDMLLRLCDAIGCRASELLARVERRRRAGT